MTTSIPLDVLQPAPKIRRNGRNQYLVVPRGEARPVGYTRATNVAKVLDSGEGLAPWKATLSVCGTLMRRGLRAQWEALMAETGGDPWYAGDESKAECKRLVEECAKVAGADDRKQVGTSLHKLAAMVAQGQQPEHLSDETRADLDAYVGGLQAQGISIVPHMVEVMVVLDAYRVAGMFDLLTVVPEFSRPLITDLKTGGSLDYSWQSYATQLAIYSRGERYVQGPAEDGSEDTRPEMPEVDQENGLIVWLPAGSAQVELFFVDLTAGWEAFERSMWTRKWRNRKVSQPFDVGPWRPATRDEDLVPAVEASLRKAANPPAEPPAPPLISECQGDPDPEPSYTLRLRAWLQSRIDAIGENAGARGDLARVWPENVPPLVRSIEHTPEQLDAVEVACNAVERAHKLLFPDPKPEAEGDPVGRLLHLFPNSTIISTEDNAS